MRPAGAGFRVAALSVHPRRQQHMANPDINDIPAHVSYNQAQGIAYE